jgi:hypothetical protein
MSELDELERDLEEAANIWFSPALHAKVKRVIQLARIGERGKGDPHIQNVEDTWGNYKNILNDQMIGESA